MRYHIPTYQECVEITQSFPPKTFFEKRKLYEDYRFSFFNYRLAEYKDFKKSNSFEMKGITFFHYNGVSKHYLMFNKFWELNQYPEFTYEHFKDKKIKKVMVKEDGNLVSFIKLPDGRIISRVKEGFKSSFNKIANEFINNNQTYLNFINYCLDKDIIPLFELVGENRIILKYEKNDLILLNMRNNLTGEYIDKLNYDMNGINIVRNEDHTLEEPLWYYAFTDFILGKLDMKRMKDYQSKT
jgi:hypothetical protein